MTELFLRMARQWRVAGECVLGLDYSVIQMLTNLFGIELTPELFDDLQTMEARAVDILNAEQKKKSKKGRKR